MYEIHGLTRRIEALERSFASALERIDHLEAQLREEDRKIRVLERDVHQEHHALERLQHGMPGHAMPVGL